ncbi:CBO0543 family protein [Metabacillus dongyingensis]|uniref:CBO0543 family protein n=1 Tax=Metabacillus dongyingensis TaxID=2874282 RepID=UPI003B8DB7EE
MKTIQSPEKIKVMRELQKKVTEANEEYLDFWLKNTLFHWDFFLSLFFTIIPLLIWIKFRKKESTARLLFAGFFVMIVSSFLDFLGVAFGKWYYTGKVIPTIPSYIPWDFVLIPVFVMFLIQFKPHWSPILKGILFAGVSSFVGEPFFKWLGFYVELEWSSFYSFPIYIVIYLISSRLSKVKSFQPIKQ